MSTRMTARVAAEHRALFERLVSLTDVFCDANLNDDYKQLCRKMDAALCRKGTPAASGKPEGWACGIVYSIGWVNFLTDPSQTPHLCAEEIASGFGVSQATMHLKSKAIRQRLRLMPFHPDWCLSSKLEDNPLVWMVTVNGFIVDIRSMPRDIQVAAYEKGVIPYVPADRQPATVVGAPKTE